MVIKPSHDRPRTRDPQTGGIQNRSNLTIVQNESTCPPSNWPFLILYLGEILKIAKNVKKYLKILFAMLFMNYSIRNRHSERIRFLHTMLMSMNQLAILIMPRESMQSRLVPSRTQRVGTKRGQSAEKPIEINDAKRVCNIPNEK